MHKKVITRANTGRKLHKAQALAGPLSAASVS
jgi:hypothetical protein